MIDLSRENPEIRGLLKELFPHVKTNYDSNLVAIAEEPEPIVTPARKSFQLTPKYVKVVKEEVDYFYNIMNKRNWGNSRVKRKAFEVAECLATRLVERRGLSREGIVISMGIVIDEVLGYLRALEK